MNSTASAPPRPASPAWSVAALAAVGLATAANLVVGRLVGAPFLCGAGSACAAVHSSHYARFLGLPTAAWGAALYVTVALLALVGLSSRPWLVAFLLSVVGVSTSAYLAYLAWGVLGAACVYCVISAAVAIALFFALIVARPRVGHRRWPLAPWSLAVLGSATAVITVVIVATVHAAAR